jgi:hypothetical protein
VQRRAKTKKNALALSALQGYLTGMFRRSGHRFADKNTPPTPEHIPIPTERAVL